MTVTRVAASVSRLLAVQPDYSPAHPNVQCSLFKHYLKFAEICEIPCTVATNALDLLHCAVDAVSPNVQPKQLQAPSCNVHSCSLSVGKGTEFRSRDTRRALSEERRGRLHGVAEEQVKV